MEEIDGAEPAFAHRVWNCVALGDTYAGGFPRYVALHLERDLGIDVTFHDWRREEQTLVELAEMLSSQQALRDLVSHAQFLSFTPALPRIGLCVSGEGDGPLGDMPLALFMQLFRADLNWVLDEILSLTSPRRALIRGMDYPCPFMAYWPRWAGTDDCMRAWAALNGEVHAIAGGRGIPVARLFDAFHGPAGDDDPWARGYFAVEDGSMTDAGARLVADVLRGLGYQRQP